MVRIIVKGGIWKNTEDEVLKAAVMKYGKNQWSRISSLLTRKTPKQCKARWFEWLDPSIRKTEWSKEEDEKLLHMAKLMPTQWRTIAPIVGRTPAQCLERYQKLLDEAELGDEAGPSSDDVRKLRPGEIDPDPESKPARPDPVDMDEDEKEMLSEARARLANTQGKKAKRKAREKQLQEARRISNLQKRRELKNAGIELKEKKKARGMDYNADIPFHKPQPAGFWDINQERVRELQEKRDLSNELLENLEGKRRIEIEEDERKKDFKKQKTKKDAGDNAPSQALQAAADPLLTTARKRLVLPAPQVTEEDLEEIVKMGVSGESAREMIESGNETPASQFVGQYSSLQAPTAMRTPRVQTESGQDVLKAMARNLKAMTESQTPLFGDDVVIEGDMNFTPAPERAIASTPNPLAGGATPRLSVGATPRANALAGKTPSRDLIGINTPARGFEFDDTPRIQAPSKPLSSLFASLPKPKNDFEIVVPELENVQDQADVDMMEEDSEIYAARLKAERDAELERQLKLRSQVIQLNLPRPSLSLSILKSMYDDQDEDVSSLIQKEKAILMHHDAITYPTLEQEPLDDFYPLERLDEYIDIASQLIKEESSKLESNRQFLNGPLLFEDYDIVSSTGEYVEVGKMTAAQYKLQHQALFAQMKSEALSSQKVEKRLTITLGGYMVRRKALEKTFSDTMDELESLLADQIVFQDLAIKERELMQIRIADESKELQRVSMIEQDLQDRFRELSYERDELNR